MPLFQEGEQVSPIDVGINVNFRLNMLIAKKIKRRINENKIIIVITTSRTHPAFVPICKARIRYMIQCHARNCSISHRLRALPAGSILGVFPPQFGPEAPKAPVLFGFGPVPRPFPPSPQNGELLLQAPNWDLPNKLSSTLGACNSRILHTSMSSS